MKIAILSNDDSTISFLEKTVEEYANRKYHKMSVIRFSNLKDYLGSSAFFDVLLIDDNFERRLSVETARLVRTKNKHVALVLIAGTPDTVYDSFTVKAHRFILKPITQSAIFEAFDSFRKEQSAYRVIVARTNKGFRSFGTDEILYVVSDGKLFHLHTKSEVLMLDTGYGNFVGQLPGEYFFTIHRSCTINMKYVKTLKGDQVIMSDNNTLNVSRRRKTEFLLAYNDYIKGHNID